MLALRMLGTIQLRTADGRDVDALLRQPKRLALLAYLASPEPGTWHRRDLLLALFWPELDTAHGRTALRNALYVLRQSLGVAVVRTRGDEEVSLDPAALRTDAAEVWAALRDGRPADALAGYGGELLPGLHPTDSDGFVRWLEAERAHVRTAVTSAGMTHADALERASRPAEALAIVRRVLALQPDHEPAVRRAIALHDALGDRAGAMTEFERYRERLRAEYDAEPSPETWTLVRRLRQPAPPTRVGAPVPDAVVPHAHTSDASRVASPAPPRTTRGTRRWLPWTAGGAMLGVVAALGLAASRPRAPLTIGPSTPLTADDGLQVEVALSSNGSLVAYAKGTPFKLRVWVQRVGGGAPWPLTDDSAATQLLPRWAPDDERILFLSRANAYVASASGGTPRLVARGTPGDGMVRAASWSPRGDSIVIVRDDSLLVLPASGAGARLVGTGRQLHGCTWSPTRPWIACVAGNWLAFETGPLFGNPGHSAIVLYPAAGGAARVLAAPDAKNEGPAWTADGAQLWFVSDRGGASDVYALGIDADGRADGAPRRVGLVAESVALSAGRIAYSVPVRRQHLWVSTPPHDTAGALASAHRLTSGTRISEVVRLSADGAWLVYDSDERGDADIYRMPTRGGAPERLTDDPRPESAGELSPDGTELAWHRWVDGRRHLLVQRLGDDSARELLPQAGDENLNVPRWAPDGARIAAWAHENETGGVFVLRREGSGAWRRLWRLGYGQLPTWSPDGRTLAFVRYDGTILAIPSDSGAVRTIYAPRDSAAPAAATVEWHGDPATLWFVGHDARGRGGIWTVPASGGTPRLRVRVDDVPGRSLGPAVAVGGATDRATIYFTLDERFSNVRWAPLRR